MIKTLQNSYKKLSFSFHRTKPFNSTFKRKMTSTTATSAVKEDAFAILHNINESFPSICILEM